MSVNVLVFIGIITGKYWREGVYKRETLGTIGDEARSKDIKLVKFTQYIYYSFSNIGKV